MNIFKSFDARKKNFMLRHFEYTKYGKNLSQLNQIYKDQRCFIIGNGPSLNPKDLDMLVDEYTFAFNRIFYIFNQTQWRPTFYCTQDEKIIENSIPDILSLIKTKYVFVPINLKWYANINLKTQFYFCPKQAKIETGYPLFSENIAHEIGVGSTVAFTAMQIAVYMGFSKIYLLGVDHNFYKSKDNNGNIIIDPTAKDYFCPQYNNDKNDLWILYVRT